MSAMLATTTNKTRIIQKMVMNETSSYGIGLGASGKETHLTHD